MKFFAISILLVAALEAAVVNGKGVKGQELRARNLELRARNLGKYNGKGHDDTPVTDAPAGSCADGSDPAPSETVNSWDLKNLYEIESDPKLSPPDCGDVGQNKSFQGKALESKGECNRVNICHGNAGFGWNRITVDRDAIGEGNNGNNGHANEEHNNDDKNKRPDYYPGSISVPNPSGAGANGYVDDQCNFVPAGGCDPEYEASDAPETESPTAPEASPVASPESAPEASPVASPVAAPHPGPTAPKPPTYITGDPHIRKFNGETYDFHGGCDLVLLQNPDFNDGQGLYIHVRTKITRWWSSIESAAIRIGEDTLEVKAGIESRPYWVNGEEGWFYTSRDFPFQIGGFSGRYRYKNTNVIQYKLVLPNEQSIVIRSVKNMLRVELTSGTEKDFGNSLGLMGSFGDGLLLARDGKKVYSEDEANAFGMHWQVTSSDPQLFHKADGPQYPETCDMPTIESGVGRRRLAGTTISHEEAEMACAHVGQTAEFNNCVFDVMATDDKDVAEGYAGAF